MDLDGWKAIPAIPVSLMSTTWPSFRVTGRARRRRSSFHASARSGDCSAAGLAERSGSGVDQLPVRFKQRNAIRCSQRSRAAGISKTDESSSQDVEETAASYLEEFGAEGVPEEDPEEQAQINSSTVDLEESLRDAEASPVVTLVDRILLQAMSVSASDIHVEPSRKVCDCATDGTRAATVHRAAAQSSDPAVTSRFKILADLDIAERRQAQDGRILQISRARD